MAKLYADENFPLPTVEELRNIGHDVLTIEEDGKANQGYPDESVLIDASSSERSVLTMNRKHFRALHNQSQSHAGIILCTYNPDFIQLAQRIHAAIQEYDSLDGQLLRVVRPQTNIDSTD